MAINHWYIKLINTIYIFWEVIVESFIYRHSSYLLEPFRLDSRISRRRHGHYVLAKPKKNQKKTSMKWPHLEQMQRLTHSWKTADTNLKINNKYTYYKIMLPQRLSQSINSIYKNEILARFFSPSYIWYWRSKLSNPLGVVYLTVRISLQRLATTCIGQMLAPQQIGTHIINSRIRKGWAVDYKRKGKWQNRQLKLRQVIFGRLEIQ
jgi:hypothetical protein